MTNVQIQEQLEAGNQLHRAGRLEEAAALYRQVLDQDPRQPDALYLLGRIQYDFGQFDESQLSLARAIAVNAREATYHHHMGQALRATGKMPEAVGAYREAIRLKPDYALAHLGLAGALAAVGDQKAAEDAALAAVACQPNSSTTRNNLGTFYLRSGRMQDADRCFHEALALDERSAEAHLNLGLLHRAQGRTSEAIAALRRAVEIAPNNDLAQFYLGVALQLSGAADEALAAYRRTIAIRPQHAEALSNMAGIFYEKGRLDSSLEAACAAIAQSAKVGSAHLQIGVVLQLQGKLDEAIEAYRAGVSLCPEEPRLQGSLCYALNFHPAYDAATIFAEHRKWAQTYADPLTAVAAPHTNDRDPERRLRVGYVAAHFRMHSVNRFSEPILNAHDHGAFEIICFNNSPSKFTDAITRRLQQQADGWRDIHDQSDDQLCDLVRQDQVDILVDLAGQLDGHRLLAFARKPAPVQVTYIGYQNTTGMLAMDYRLTDDWSDPPGTTDAYYTEKLVRLPKTFFCYQPIDDVPPITGLPFDANGQITFGSFNNFSKVTPQVLDAWATILSQVSGSRLVMLALWADSAKRRVQEFFASRGIDSGRIDFHGHKPPAEFLKALGQVDIALDPFPFNGHTTTCDALLMGVPVVALAGTSYASRFGSSAHHHLGLQDLIATTEDDYIEIAVRLAADTNRLRQLRRELRGAMLASPICDARQFTRNLELAYRQMWRDWCARP